MIRRLAAKANSLRRQPYSNSVSILVLVGLSALAAVRPWHRACAATPHHAAAVLHHGLVRRNHPAFGKIGHLRGVILKGLDGCRVGRGLDDEIPFSVASYVLLILSLSRKIECSAGLSIGKPGSRPSSTRFPISATCFLIVAATCGIVRFRNGADAVGEVRHRAFDAIVVEEQAHGCRCAHLMVALPPIIGPYPSCRAHLTLHAGPHLTAHAGAHLAMHTHSHAAHPDLSMTG